MASGEHQLQGKGLALGSRSLRMVGRYLLQNQLGGKSIAASSRSLEVLPADFPVQRPWKPGRQIDSSSFIPSCASNSSLLLQALCMVLHVPTFGFQGT